MIKCKIHPSLKLLNQKEMTESAERQSTKPHRKMIDSSFPLLPSESWKKHTSQLQNLEHVRLKTEGTAQIGYTVHI